LPLPAPRSAPRSRPLVPPPDSLGSAGSLSGLLGAGRLSLNLGKSAAYELKKEDASRARAFSVSAIVLTVLVLAEEGLFDASPASSVLSLASFVALGFAAVHAFRVAREPLRYTRPVARTLAGAAYLASTCLIYRMGPFSPAPMVTMLVIAFFG